MIETAVIRSHTLWKRRGKTLDVKQSVTDSCKIVKMDQGQFLSYGAVMSA